jgi:hypothetical protein
MSLIFAFRWDGIDLLGMAEKLLCFVQARRKKWDYITWNQISERKDQAIKSKDGEAKADCVEYKHLRSAIAQDK